MASRNWLITLVLVVLCGGTLVLLTDVEVSLVRWVNLQAILYSRGTTQ